MTRPDRTTTERGYGWSHQQQRAYWQQRLDAGERITCRSQHCRCGGRPVDPTNWQLGHTDDRTAWTGPENPRCNLATNRGQSDRGRPSREW